MRLIDADAAIDVVSKTLKGIFVEYQDVAEKTIGKVPTAEPTTLYGYNIKHLAFIAAVLQKEHISPEELKAMLTDIRRMMQFIIDDITDTIQREIDRQIGGKHDA